MALLTTSSFLCLVCRSTTSIQEDEELLSYGGARLSLRVQAAVAARLERKHLLATAQQMLQQYAAQL